MSCVRFFVPAGGGPLQAKLQIKDARTVCTSPGSCEEYWIDVPYVYEDPNDELVRCPRVDSKTNPHPPSPHWICGICSGAGWVRKGDLKELMKRIGPEGDD